ncbi:MAG: tRNA (adenosine(37)-N6)-dimethylallyltransferase MiaA [Burkholderiales bacterium]|nr:MAG: tRNA (adenosine(37)-N6)-dimethylallyltransferase MiaA [Burkholderiales bacterium]
MPPAIGPSAIGPSAIGPSAIGPSAEASRAADTGAVLALLLGPTASGKSAIALELGGQLPLEIVSVDSAQVYRGMDIGTAKPSATERAQLAHHLIDIVDPAKPYSAARFVRDARAAMAKIAACGRLALPVGGTMLYARALTEGLDRLPAADAALRARLEAEAREHGWPALHRRLADLDPDTAARLAPNDAQRIQRALEVHALTGEPMSRLLGARGPGRAEPRFCVIALEPSDRSALHARIARRFDAMLAAGLVDEVAALRARGDLHPGLPSMRCVGYRQCWDYLDGRIDRDALRERGIAATRQLAKRQLTWLRAMPERHVVDCLASSAARQVLELIERCAAGDLPGSD